MKLSIKFVKKARQWCLTYFLVDSKSKESRKQEWFNSKLEALKRVEEL